jgi:hypothetical protein
MLMERVEVQVDAATASYLRACVRRHGESMADAVARQLRELAVADGVAKLAAWAQANPSFFDDAEAERIAASSA